MCYSSVLLHSNQSELQENVAKLMFVICNVTDIKKPVKTMKKPQSWKKNAIMSTNTSVSMITVWNDDQGIKIHNDEGLQWNRWTSLGYNSYTQKWEQEHW